MSATGVPTGIVITIEGEDFLSFATNLSERLGVLSRRQTRKYFQNKTIGRSRGKPGSALVALFNSRATSETLGDPQAAVATGENYIAHHIEQSQRHEEKQWRSLVSL